MAVLQVKDLEVAFKKNKHEFVCVDRVNFEINEGEILCVVGESGCGKSVTAKSIMGLLGDTGYIKSGEVSFLGTNLVGLNEKKFEKIRGDEMAMVFQNAMNSLNPCFTIENQLCEAIHTHLDLNKIETKRLAISLLEKVGLADAKDIMKKYPHMLSGGMQQRVMIAMALVCRPKLLIADEPTTALDVTIQLQIMKLLKELRDEYHMAILLITHDMGVVAEMADRVMVMYAGQCVEEASVYELFENPRHPYTRALLASIPSINDDRDKVLHTITGTVPENYEEIKGCRFCSRCEFAQDQCSKEQHYVEIKDDHKVKCKYAV